MRTETIVRELFTFKELSEDAKEKALQEWAESEQEYFWGDDAIKSLKAGIEYFNCTLNNYSIDFFEYHRSDISISGPYNDPTEDELKSLIESAGSYNPETLKGLGDCKLTGYCADEDFLDGARADFANGERDVKELVMSGFNTWHKAATEDCKSQFTMEYFSEHAAANDYEFTEDGSRA